MNQLSIKCRRRIGRRGKRYRVVAFLIDGRPFLDMASDFEPSFAGDLAGEYDFEQPHRPWSYAIRGIPKP